MRLEQVLEFLFKKLFHMKWIAITRKHGVILFVRRRQNEYSSGSKHSLDFLEHFFVFAVMFECFETYDCVNRDVWQRKSLAISHAKFKVLARILRLGMFHNVRCDVDADHAARTLRKQR